jgi:hypothetical protein
MAFFMRRLVRGAIAFAALILILAGGVFIAFKLNDARVDEFYAEHPLLQRMRAIPANDPAMVKILMERVPIGSTRDEAFRILAVEGFRCNPSNAPTPNSLACWTLTRPSSVPRWYVEVKFDEADKVAGGRVFPFKATAT